MVRSTSSLRPIKGSILPLRAESFRFVAYFSKALPPPSPSRSTSGEAPPSSRSLRSSPPAFDRPCAMKLTTSRRDTSCMLSR